MTSWKEQTALTWEETSRLINDRAKCKIWCRCSHPVIMPKWVDKQECRWCHRMVFRDKEKQAAWDKKNEADEFRLKFYKIQKKLKKKERE